MNRPDVMKLFAEQHWVAAVGQLSELGVSVSAIHRARQRGVVVSPTRGVVAVAGVKLSFKGRALAAQLALAHEAFVSGPSAGVIHGLRKMPRKRIEITLKEARRLQPPKWCRVVRTSWIVEERDVIVYDDGLRVASPLRTLFGLAAEFNQHRFE